MKEYIISGGYIPDKSDVRNYSYGSVFGEFGKYPRKIIRDFFPINIPYQGRVPSCVVCSFTFLNEYKSFINEGSNLNLSWRRPFSQTGPYNTGRNLADVAKYLQSTGQPQDTYCTDNPDLPEPIFMNPAMSKEGLDDELKRIIGNHWWIRPDNMAELCSAVVREPVVVTFGGINLDWQKPFDEIVVQSNGSDWYHAVVLWDYDLDAGYFRIINWWGDNVRKISINYKLTSALSFQDLPDGGTMFKIIKTANKDDNWLITGNTRRRIPDADTFHYFKGQLGIINDPVVITQEEFDRYTEGEMLPSVLLTRTVGTIAPDIFLKE